MQNIFNTIKTSSLEKYTSHFIRKGSKGLRKVLSVRDELETEQNCNILTPTLLAIAAFLGLLNRGPGTWFSFQHLLSNWSELPVMLYNNLTSTYFLRASQFTLNSTRRQSRLSPEIFDRIHLLFTQVHFLFWQLGRVPICNTIIINSTSQEIVTALFQTG